MHVSSAPIKKFGTTLYVASSQHTFVKRTNTLLKLYKTDDAICWVQMKCINRQSSGYNP